MEIEADFELEKETKNTVRYAEVTDGKPPIVRTIYVQKWRYRSLTRSGSTSKSQQQQNKLPSLLFGVNIAKKQNESADTMAPKKIL